jgi:hypothetical protein
VLTGPEAISQLAGGKVLPIYLEGRVVPVQNDISRELGLSANQVIRAVVEQRPEGLIILINGRPVELAAQLRFRPGDLIWLKVVQTSQGLVLQTTAPPAGQAGQAGSAAPGQPLPTGTAAPLPTAAVSPMVASLFAQPANFNGLMSLFSSSGSLASLSTLAQSSGALGPLALFLNARPSMGRLSPDGVRAALAASGFLTEARLAAGKSVRVDLKAGLREALQRMTGTTAGAASGLKSMLESAVRELESSQADALSASSQKEFLFSFLIPFRDADPVLVTFQRPPAGPDDPEAPFIINLHTRSEGLGEVWMKTVVGRKTRLDLTMWADRSETARRAELAKSELAEELESAGLSLASLMVFHGRRPTEHQPIAPDEGHGVVFDQRA